MGNRRPKEITCQSFGPASQNNCGGLLCGDNVLCGGGKLL
jgi:hypothetical protein